MILAKGATMRINANLEPTYLAPPLPRVLLRVVKCLSLTCALDHEPCPPLIEYRDSQAAVELNLLGKRSVLQGSCAFLALLMANICLHFVITPLAYIT